MAMMMGMRSFTQQEMAAALQLIQLRASGRTEFWDSEAIINHNNSNNSVLYRNCTGELEGEADRNSFSTAAVSSDEISSSSHSSSDVNVDVGVEDLMSNTTAPPDQEFKLEDIVGDGEILLVMKKPKFRSLLDIYAQTQTQTEEEKPHVKKARRR